MMAPSFDSPPATPDPFSRPRPRPPRSPAHTAQIRVQNRRRAYLDRHRSYFQSGEHELAGRCPTFSFTSLLVWFASLINTSHHPMFPITNPHAPNTLLTPGIPSKPGEKDPLLYDFLIRRFQTPSEREAEGRAKGYARVLEGSLLRGEERLAKLRARTVGQNNQDQNQESESESDGDGGGGGSGGDNATVGASPSSASATAAAAGMYSGTYAHGGGGGGAAGRGTTETEMGEPGTTFSSLNAELVPPPKTREEGRAQWEEFLRDRFIRGEDGDFDYARVDEDDEYDVLEREDREESWFEDEDPEWATSSDEDGGEKADKVLHGETGIQDF